MKRVISLKTSQKIKNMSLFSALLVTLLHMKWGGGDDSGIVELLCHVVRNGICKVAVPYFFVVSGFFIAKHFDDIGWYRQAISKRIRSLCIPYVFWQILTVLVFWMTDVLIVNLLSGNGVAIPSLRDMLAGFMQIIGLDLTRMPRVFPFWFIRALFLLVLITPIIKLALERFGKSFVLVLFLASIAVTFINYGPVITLLEYGLSISGAFYFTIGIFIARFNISRQSGVLDVCICSLGVCLFVLRIVFAYVKPEYAGLLGAISLPFVLYLVWCCVPQAQLPVWLTSCAFPIYMMHLLLIHLYGPLVKRLPLGSWHILFCFLFTFVSCCVLAALIRKKPKVAHLLYGNR